LKVAKPPKVWFNSLVHQHSQEKIRVRKAKQEQKELARSIVLNFSLYCKDNGEKVFEAETERTVREKLEYAFGFLPAWAVDKEYGEVLNRHLTRIHPMTVKWTTGRMQRISL